MKWLFNKKEKDYPEFWSRYENLFIQPKQPELDIATFTVLDTETTGFDYIKDRILCIGAIKIINGVIDVASSFEIYVTQDYFNAETVHIHGILKHEKIERFTEEEAIIKFLDYIQDDILVAHHAFFDINMINQALARLGLPFLKNQVLDTMHIFRATKIKSNLLDPKKRYTLDEIAEYYHIDLSDRHTAAGDALITAIAFIRSVQTLVKTKNYTLKNLLKL